MYFSIIFIYFSCILHHINSEGVYSSSLLMSKTGYLEGKVIKTYSTIGILQCSKQCSLTSGCLSINYNSAMHSCDLNYGDDTAHPLKVDDNYKYYEIKDKSYISLGECSNNTCDVKHQCVTTKRHGPKCVPTYCNPPPTPPKTDVTPGECYIGKTHQFVCSSGYGSSKVPETTCKADTTWSPVTAQCKECGEPPLKSNALVNGGSKLVGSTRLYTCFSQHRREGTATITCQSNAVWSNTNLYCRPYRWPKGLYALYKGSNGCPADASWAEGYRTQYLENSNPQTSWSSSISSHMTIYLSKTAITHYFCARNSATQTNDDLPWQPGKYCILQYSSTCPTGFSSGNMRWDDENDVNNNQYGGTLPYGSYGSSVTVIYFCCRSDGSTSSPLYLPTTTPFYLIRYGGVCQTVAGMSVLQEFIKYDCEDTSNTNSAYPPHPDSNHSPGDWQIYFCYYY